MTTDERIENLEKGLATARRLNRWLLAVIALALVGVAYTLASTFTRTANTTQDQRAGSATESKEVRAAQRWQDDPVVGGAEKVICANAFIVQDDNGKACAVLDGPGLTLFDDNGTIRAVLAVNKNGPWLELYDENGETRAQLAVHKDGPGLTLSDENDKPRATLRVHKGGSALDLFDENGEPRVALAVGNLPADRMARARAAVKAGGPITFLHRMGAGLVLYDQKGIDRARLVAFEDASELNFQDENGNGRVCLSGYKDMSRLRLGGERGKLRSERLAQPLVSAELSVHKDKSMLFLSDENGKVKGWAP